MITGRTRLVGIIGWPVAHSRSPEMHNAAFAALGLDFIYVPLPVEPARLEEAVRGLSAGGFRGVNVTVPHKEAVPALLDEIDPAARAIGAVNTILFDDGENSRQGAPPSAGPLLRGYNTDWSGFLADLESYVPAVQGRECIVLGAGGSARAVVYALAKSEGHVRVFARRLEQAGRLVADLAPHLPGANLQALNWEEAFSPQIKPDLIVNTTPLGMGPDSHSSPWPNDVPLPATAFVYDLVYSPPVTRFLEQAQACGCRTASGLGMLLWQGAQAFEIWTGRKPDVGVMRRALGLPAAEYGAG